MTPEGAFAAFKVISIEPGRASDSNIELAFNSVGLFGCPGRQEDSSAPSSFTFPTTEPSNSYRPFIQTFKKLPDRTSTSDIGFHFHKASPILSTSFTLATLRSATPSLPLRAHPRLLQPSCQPYRQRYWESYLPGSLLFCVCSYTTLLLQPVASLFTFVIVSSSSRLLLKLKGTKFDLQ
jgi:hypothetical protein